jgi:ABC-type transport system involved in multi-copper enzyme maturation permease subunit
MAALFQATGVVVIMQGILVGEKKEGTAAWVLSKPAARPAFILSKVVANSLGVLVTMVGVSAVVFHILCFVAKRAPPNPIDLVVATGLILLHHLFYITLMLMLGALSGGRGPVLGIPAGLVLLQFNLIRWLPALRYVLPLNLLMEINGHGAAVVALLAGRSIHSYIPIMVVVAVECFLFLLVALWRFNREEL